MTQPIRDLCLSYKTLLQNIKAQHKEHDPVLLERLCLVNQTLTDATIAVDELNRDLLQDVLTLTPQQQEELDDMAIIQKTLKVFSPYMMWYNLYQKELSRSASAPKEHPPLVESRSLHDPPSPGDDVSSHH